MPESSSVSGFAYRAFISYSHRDKAWGDWLHRALEMYRVPSRLVGKQTEAGVIPRRLNPVFRDREELSSSPELGSKINAALAKSENLIVICSPASAASRWVNEEVLAYERIGRGDRIFCLIVGGEPNATDMPARATEECFCPALRFKLDANGQPTNERTEPIAADARPGKDGKANGKLKLIAGMLGVGFDALKQRELQRRTRRLTAIAALALVVMAGTSALAIYALISRHRAVVAQREAIVEKTAAQRRQKQAEGLVNFMLGDLYLKLDAVGRLDILQSVDAKAMAYFQSLPNSDLNDTALAQRAKALERIGDVRVSLGQAVGALQAYQESARISQRLAAAHPVDTARQLAYSQTLTYIGYVDWNQSKLDAALAAYQSAQQVLQSAQPHAKGNLSLIEALLTLDNDIGHVQETQGQLAAATTSYQATLALAQKLLAAKPGDKDYIHYVGSAHNDLGKVDLERGDLAMAIAEYRADDAIETRLSARDPKDTAQRVNMLTSRAILGRTLALAGDTAGGVRALYQAVALAGQLAKFEPKDTGTQVRLGLYSTELARLQRLGGDLAVAQTLNAKSIAIYAALLGKDPGNSGWQSYYATALTEQAAQSSAAADTEAARRQAQAALHILDPILAKHPDERDTLLRSMTANLLLASVTSAPATAAKLRQQSLATMQAQTSGKDDPRLLALQVDALLALHRASDAQPLIKRLWSAGYRDPAFVAVLQRARITYPANPAFRARLLAASAHREGAGVSKQPGHTPQAQK